MQEINYQNAIYSPQWSLGDFDNIANIAPVKIIEINRRGNKTYTCSTTDIQVKKELITCIKLFLSNPYALVTLLNKPLIMILETFTKSR